MLLKRQRRYLFLVGIAALLLSANFASAQGTARKRLRSPATVRGFVGGEAQNHYLIRARKGQIMTVRISWQPDGDNTAGFDVSAASGSGDAGGVVFGKESDNSKHWTGKIPKTGDYVISVVAHPSAHYTLRVTVR